MGRMKTGSFHFHVIGSILLCCLAVICYGGVHFSSLKHTLLLQSSPNPNAPAVLKSGEDEITITWSLNQTAAVAGIDSSYKTVKIKLCYGRISQVDRPWRKTVDDLDKDKTCQHKVAVKPYAAVNNSIVWIIPKDVPTATYFIRVYAYDGSDVPVGYGQTADVFEIEGITGRHASLDIASACFSVFSIVSLFGFFFLEKKKIRANNNSVQVK